MNTSKKQAKQYVDANPIEAVRDTFGAIGDSLISDVAQGAMHDFWNSFFGSSEKRKTSGELAMGQEIDLRAVEKHKAEGAEPALDYRREILHGERKIARQETQELSEQISQIVFELKRLMATSQELEIQFREVAVEQKIEYPSKYHLSFYEWVLSAIKTARMRIEESSSWLSLFQSKKNKRQYWAMFKKHGTSFGLSNERVVATQTG